MKNEKITDALNGIRPAADAKQRMYENILKKSEVETMSEPETATRSKKSWKSILAIAACLAVVAVGALSAQHFLSNKKPTAQGAEQDGGVFAGDYSELDQPGGDTSASDGGNMQSINPIAPVDSTKEFAKMGIKMDTPDGAENVQYCVIGGTLAQADFSLGEITYSLRGSKAVNVASEEELTGIYGKTASQKKLNGENGVTVKEIKDGDTTNTVILWSVQNVRYCLTAFNCGASQTVEQAARAAIQTTRA